MTVKSSLIFVLALIAFGGLLAFINQYYLPNGVFNNLAGNQRLSQERLVLNYKSQYRDIIKSYLDNLKKITDFKDLQRPELDNLFAETQNTKKQLLALTVPATGRERHLKTVLLLASLEINIEAEDMVAAADIAEEIISLNDFSNS